MFEKLYRNSSVFSEQESKIKILEKQIENCKKEASNLTSLVVSLSDENTELKNKLTSALNELSNFRSVCSDISTLNSKLSSLKINYEATQDFYERLIDENEAEYRRVIEEKKSEMRTKYNALKTAYNEKIISLDENFKLMAKEHDDKLRLQEFENLRRFITYDEFFNNTSADRCQLALNRYNALNKTSYEIGLLYERYIGYLYEKEGYTVRYHGAVKQYKDRGIDIIVNKKRSKDVYIIQCKNWNKKSIIRENIISQLAGSVEYMKKEKYKTKNVYGLLYSTCPASTEAQEFANKLNIELHCEFPLSDYPKVKCNNSTTSNEKIYHMPFDSNYDRVFINPSDGDLYVNTAQEAESYGFRHAKKWKPKEE